MRLQFCLATVLFAIPSLAQEVTGAIVGTVRDASGASIPGVSITVTAADKNQVVRKITSDANGEYVAAFVPVGVYFITADAKGFKPVLPPGCR
jgi:hypothetical protein